jgi:uncharacterized SAM-binding protein YcdF (DUF218 family)
MIELLTRILCDTRPAEMADAAFLFGQTADNQDSVFVTAKDLLQNLAVRKILFMDTPPLSGYPGYAAWRQDFIELGIAEEFLAGVPPTDTTILHTLIEAESMALYARQKKYTRIILVASPFQQLRAFMTAVTAVKRHYPALRLYSQPGKTLPWQEPVTHSQGTVTGTRSSLIAGELERIEKYQAQGNIVSTEEVLEYLNKR